MLGSLPDDIRRVFERFITTEYVTIDAGGQPIAWPVTPYVDPNGKCLDVTTGLGYPKKARDAERNPHVALLFSDPTGSGLADAPTVLVQGTARVDESDLDANPERNPHVALLFSDPTGSGLDNPPAVLVQGTAHVDDQDLDANRERYERESFEKLPATKSALPPKPVRRFFLWYFARIYVHVRPERVFVWRGGDIAQEPDLYLADQAEVRSGHSEAPSVAHHAPTGGTTAWDHRLEQANEGVIAVESPDGWPFAARVPIRADRGAGVVRVLAEPLGAPLQPGLACLTVHEHAPDFSWQTNFQARGDLAEDGEGWSFTPHKIVGGFELPPGSQLERLKLNWSKSQRFRRIAKREMGRR
jgi:hypothetical protein